MLKGSKVRLRAVEKEDIPELMQLRNEEEVLLNRVSKIPYPIPVAAEEESYAEKCKKKHRDYLEFVIEKLDGTIIGKCGTMDTKWVTSEVTVYIFIGGDGNRGCGYGSEAMQLLIRFIFEQMNLNRVRLFVFAFNTRAVKSYEKTGFKVEGTLRQELFRNGRYHDVIQMSILKREYDEMVRGEYHA